MLILHILPDLYAGGAELMLKRLIEAQFRDPGIEHRVVSLRGGGSLGPRLRELGVQVEVLGLRSLRALPSALRRLRWLIRASQPDIVQTWMYHADLLGGLAALSVGQQPIIWSVRSTHIPPGRGTARLTTIIRRACAIISSKVPTRIVYVAESARLVHERLGYAPNKGLVIPNGYEIPPRIGQAERRMARSNLGIRPNQQVIGSAGRYNALKDYPTFIAAASQLASRHPDVHFLLAGRQLDWDNLELAELITAAGLQNRVTLLGERQNLTEFLSAIDLFCLHSISEGFPNVVAEAMAVAVPCVVTDVGDTSLIVGDTGAVVAPEQPERLVEALEELLAEEPERRVNRGLRARQRIAANFGLQAISARYAELYENLIVESRPEARELLSIR